MENRRSARSHPVVDVQNEVFLLRVPWLQDAWHARQRLEQRADNEAIEDVVNIAVHFNSINRVADAFDFPLSDEKSRSRHIRFLDQVGNPFRATRPEYLVVGYAFNHHC